jgi:hypothetical protein
MNTLHMHFMRLLRKCCHGCMRNFVHCSLIYAAFQQNSLSFIETSHRFYYTSEI